MCISSSKSACVNYTEQFVLQTATKPPRPVSQRLESEEQSANGMLDSLDFAGLAGSCDSEHLLIKF